MIIQLGKTYKTRAGDLVKIIDIDYSYTMPFFGRIVTVDGKQVRPAGFNAAGMYKNTGEQSCFDIVNEYTIAVGRGSVGKKTLKPVMSPNNVIQAKLL